MSAAATTAEDCRLWLKSVQAGAFKTLFEVLKDIIHDVNIIFDETGGKIMCFDGARCALIHVKLRADAFEEYVCHGKVRCGINMSAIFKLVRMCSNHDTIVLYNREDACNELGVRICNSERNSRTEFRLKLMDINESEYSVPEVEFDSVMTIPSAFFHRIVRDMYNLAPTMTITAHEGTLKLVCDGDFASQETVIGGSEEGMSVTQQCSEPITGAYSLKYLAMFCKAYNLCTTAELFIKRDYALVLKYNVYGIGEIRFLLGEKTDDD
jgi:proliferating cell nuclear antigen